MNLKKDYLFFGLDELEFTVGDINKDIYIQDVDNQTKPLWNLDDDNSTTAEIDFAGLNWTYSNIKPKGYDKGLKFQTIIDGKIVDCFALLKGRHNKGINNPSKDKVVFYSSFFVLEYSNKLPFSLAEFYENYFTDKTQLYRMDIAFDLPYRIPELKKTLFKNVNFFSEIGKDTKHPEFSQTYYINNPQNDRNRKFIFRIYDKVKDTWVKKKGFLYPHLANNPDVRRIELELRPEECKRLPVQDVAEILKNTNKNTEKTFAKFFNRYSLKPLSYQDIDLKKYTNKRYDLKGAYLEYGHIPALYVSRTHGYIKNIQENTGYDGLFQVLLNVQKDEEGISQNRNLFDGYDLLENLIKYLIKEGLRQSIINRILKKYILTPKVKLCKKLLNT